MDQNRGLDLGDVLVGGTRAVVGHRGREIGSQPDRQCVGDAAAVAEAGGADFARAVGTRLQPLGGGHEIFQHLLADRPS